MDVLQLIRGFFEGTMLSGVSDPVLGMVLILGIIIALRIVVRVANIVIKLGSVALGILAILWIMSSMA